jgi:hypothetical protein
MQTSVSQIDQLPIELRCLVACCQEEHSSEEVKLISNNIPLLGSKRFIMLAQKHGVLPVVYRTLKNFSIKNQPLDSAINSLKQHYLLIAQTNMFMSAELLRLKKLFETNGIVVLVFKGPVLAQQLYGDITQRQYSDLDILIRQSDINKVAQILQSCGYVPIYPLSPTQHKTWYRHAKDMTFIHPSQTTHIDVHWKLMDSDHPIQVSLKEIWEHPIQIYLKDIPLSTFSNEEMLSYLCIHGSKHLWEKIEWIKDIDSFIRTQSINWDKVKHLMQYSGSEHMIVLGLYLSHLLYATPLPKELHKKMEQQLFLSEVTSFVFLNWESKQNMIAHTYTMLRLFPKASMKLRYIWKVIFKPSQNEYRFTDLPRPLYWMYYLLRPYLLTKKYFKNS